MTEDREELEGEPAPDEPVEGADELPEARDGDASDGQDAGDDGDAPGAGDTSVDEPE